MLNPAQMMDMRHQSPLFCWSSNHAFKEVAMNSLSIELDDDTHADLEDLARRM